MLHALTIGIDTFESTWIRRLNYARRDAEAVARLLERIAPDERRVSTLLDEQATRDNVLKAMDVLAASVQKGDVVVVHVATHGTPEKRSPKRSPSAFLVLHDTEYNHIHATGLDLEMQIVDWMERFEKASLAVMFLDTCFSGAAGGRTFERTHMDDGTPPAPVSIKDLDLGEGRVVITAADADELAVEPESLQHGIFTYHLLEALKRPGDGAPTIGLGALYERVAREVARATAGKQHPIMNGRNVLGALPTIPV